MASLERPSDTMANICSIAYYVAMNLALELPLPDAAPLAAGPARSGRAAIEYRESTSLLALASGFMGAYKFTLNPYAGCSFGCDYCYAKAFAPTLAERETWGDWVRVKANSLRLLDRATRSKSPRQVLRSGDAVYMSSVTDPYQPLESHVGLTRAILERLADVQPRLTIQTRSPVVTRDIDLFQRFEHLRVNMTITTDDDEVRKRYEGRCPSIEQRFRALETLKEAGIPIGVSVSPMLPVSHPASFGGRLAALDASEYVTQFFHNGGSWFRASTANATLTRVHHDGWNGEKYARVVEQLRDILGPTRPLLEGSHGFAPP